MWANGQVHFKNLNRHPSHHCAVAWVAEGLLVRVFHDCLDVAISLLGTARNLLVKALDLLFFAANHFPRSFLHFTSGLFGGAFDLILVHLSTPGEFDWKNPGQAWRDMLR